MLFGRGEEVLEKDLMQWIGGGEKSLQNKKDGGHILGRLTARSGGEDIS
jgi:hypothetical protein